MVHPIQQKSLKLMKNEQDMPSPSEGVMGMMWVGTCDQFAF
jgi:hypothetical protein